MHQLSSKNEIFPKYNYLTQVLSYLKDFEVCLQ